MFHSFKAKMTSLASILQLIDSSVTDQNIRKDAYQLLADRRGIDIRTLYFYINDVVDEIFLKQFQQDLNDLISEKPLHRILGYRYFWKQKFFLSADTLEPRPDTEILIESCLKHLPAHKEPYRIIDLGTGSGCILLSLLQEYPNATGLGVDISEGALRTAQYNADCLNLYERAEWIQSDWTSNVTDSFDIIVSNPPYITSAEIKNLHPSVRNYDPLAALDGGENGLQAYKKIASESPLIMKPDTLIILEIGYDQEISVQAIFTQHNYKVVDIVKDYGGNPRCLLLKR